MVLAQHIHDAELSALFHHEPIFRHHAALLPAISSAALFEAPSAAIWAQKWREERETRRLTGASFHVPSVVGGSKWCTLPYSVDTPMMVKYALLSGIGASIAECRHLKYLTVEPIARYESELIQWHETFSGDSDQSTAQSSSINIPFSLLPLWSYTFMTLTTDIDMLECAIGKRGASSAAPAQQYAQSWASSPNARRCLLHALTLQQNIADCSVGSVMAIHTPRILFAAAVCWHAYMVYAPHINRVARDITGSREDGELESLKHLPEVRRPSSRSGEISASSKPSSASESVERLTTILAANPAEMKAATLCVIENALRRLGSWGISITFADLVQTFIFGKEE